MTAATFDEATAVAPGARLGAFTAELDPGWTVGGRPNGGYLLAILGRAAVWDAPTFAVVAASAHFLRTPEPGGVDLKVVGLREGRTIGHVRARMSQDGIDCVEALITLGSLGSGAGAHWAGTLPTPPALARDQCVRLTPEPGVFEVPLLDQVDVRLTPASMRWAHGEPSGAGRLAGWLALPGEASLDPLSLLFAVDALPPATFDIAMTGWVPTHQLSVYVRGLPAPGPVQVVQRAHLIADGRVDESCHVWDQAGTLVAHSTQLAGIRLPRAAR